MYLGYSCDELFIFIFFTAFDYCNDIYNETICTKDKDTNCLKGYWVHVCAKSCACKFNKHLLLIQVSNNNLII